jgi:hypothetical protein
VVARLAPIHSTKAVTNSVVMTIEATDTWIIYR